MQTFKKILLLTIVLCCNIGIKAQVDNYCIHLTNGGTVDCGSMPELDEKKSYTIQFWMKPEAWESGSVILSRGDGLKIQTGAAGDGFRKVAAGWRLSRQGQAEKRTAKKSNNYKKINLQNYD